MEGVGGDEIKQRNVIADGAEQLLGPAHEIGMVWLVVTMRWRETVRALTHNPGRLPALFAGR
jgi:hypothetical protein